MIQRRSFLGGILAACAAPAYVKAGILMPVRKVWTLDDAAGQYNQALATWSRALADYGRATKATIAAMTPMVEYWSFEPWGDTCTVVVKGTGRVVRSDRWPHGQSPLVLTNPIQQASDKLAFVVREFEAEAESVARQ